MRVKTKKYILPIMVFLIGVGILGGAIYNVRNNQQEQRRTMANLNAMTYAERMKTDVNKGIAVTDTLEQILVSENGTIDKFPDVAEELMTDSIQSIQIAPDGVVTDIYPEEGNEAGKIDLLNDKDRGEVSNYAKDNHALVMQGPFQLKQGGDGMAVRNPVYLKDENGQEYFWGFTIVIIRVPEIFSDSIKALSDFGYEYALYKTTAPWTDDFEEVYSSGQAMTDPVSYVFEIGGSQWKLEVMPCTGWFDNGRLYEIFGAGLLIVILLTGLTSVLLALDENQKKFKRLAATDVLTGIYNRHGFDEQVMKYLKQHPGKSCVGIQFDIDDFKFINDMYGHASGDRALQILSAGMQKFFGEDAILGRKGGDEFCIFLPDCTAEKAAGKLVDFTKQERSFLYEKERITYTISLGYAEYPKHGTSYAKLMRCADAALYEVKLDGKNGCMEYQEGIGLEIRTQLGFALKDVSENLPGAFIIYKADKEDDEIFFANRELIRLTGCKDVEELLTYTQGSFRNLIKEAERKEVEEDIWQQIEEGHSNDYVHFHMKKKDGTYLEVLDHGRIVESERYGRVFYVLIMDWNSINRHYKDQF